MLIERALSVTKSRLLPEILLLNKIKESTNQHIEQGFTALTVGHIPNIRLVRLFTRTAGKEVSLEGSFECEDEKVEDFMKCSLNVKVEKNLVTKIDTRMLY